MPELPEVETIVRQLRPALILLRVDRVDVLDSMLGEIDVDALHGMVVCEVARVGKWAAIGLRRPRRRIAERWLCFHLRMTGRLIWRPDSRWEEDRKPRAAIFFDRGALFFSDVRRFGIMRLCDCLDDVAPAGLDPVGDRFTLKALDALMGESRQAVRVWLMRQDRLSGIGNIYASEILFDCRIDPRRETRTLNRTERRRLHTSIQRILTTAIENCGVTFSDFQDSRGEIGSYQQFLNVYGRQQQKCRRCAGRIQRIVQQQRSAFFCGKCQK